MSLKPTPTGPEVVQADLAKRVQILEAVSPAEAPTDFYAGSFTHALGLSAGTPLHWYTSDGLGALQYVPLLGSYGFSSPAGFTDSLFNPFVGSGDGVPVGPGLYWARFTMVLDAEPADPFLLYLVLGSGVSGEIDDLLAVNPFSLGSGDPLSTDTVKGQPNASDQWPFHTQTVFAVAPGAQAYVRCATISQAAGLHSNGPAEGALGTLGAPASLAIARFGGFTGYGL